uniref:Uncharacterized protein n=1 Tax=Anguilla anguilla TaxID=7936 RepID=A0A0E9PS36_ANGAN
MVSPRLAHTSSDMHVVSFPFSGPSIAQPQLLHCKTAQLALMAQADQRCPLNQRGCYWRMGQGAP